MAIEDFGKKIGGAKKDLWKERGLSIEDLLEFNDAERLKFIKKDNVWKKPDYEEMVRNGLPVRVAYFIKLVRDSLPTKPELSHLDNTVELINQKQDGYISFITQMRDAAMVLKTEDDVKNFFRNEISPYITQTTHSRYVEVSPEAFGCITNKLLECTGLAERTFRNIDRDIKKKQFCYSEDQKILAPYTFNLYSKDIVAFKKDYHNRNMMEISIGFGRYSLYPDDKWMKPEEWKENTYFVCLGSKLCGRNFTSVEDAKQFVLDFVKKNQKEAGLEEVSEKRKRKRAFLPKQLEHIKRNGTDYRNGISITGQDYLDAFGFRGGEFGNWLNDKDRQASLDFGYEAFLDLSQALNITPKDLSLGGRLSIAFGSRGSGSALAHYEPLREVINLTKMKGAGSLAHEWAHALDGIIGSKLGVGQWMSERPRHKNSPKSLEALISSLRYKETHGDEAVSSQKEDVIRLENRLRRDVNQFFSSTLTVEQSSEKDRLLDVLIATAGDCKEKCSMCIFKGSGYPELDAISDFRKEVYGRVIPKDWRIQIAHDMNALRSSLENVGSSKVVKTEFYKNSIKFDDIHSKTDHGYWQSTIEMFARAFACYVHDKLKENGVQSDYLCGHSDMAISLHVNKKGEKEVIKAFPEGDEREQINKCFDALFEELREMQLLHPLEKVPDVSELENYKGKFVSNGATKVSLDDKIVKAKKKVVHKEVSEKVGTTHEKSSENRPEFYENTSGQLQFIFH